MTATLDPLTQTVCLQNELGSTVLVVSVDDARDLRDQLKDILGDYLPTTDDL